MDLLCCLLVLVVMLVGKCEVIFVVLLLDECWVMFDLVLFECIVDNLLFNVVEYVLVGSMV